MQDHITRVNLTNDLSVDLLAGFFEVDRGYDIQEVNSTQVHIQKIDQGGVEDVLISKKPTYKGGALFEIYSVNSGGDGAYNAGAKLGRMFAGKNALSHISDMLRGFDTGLGQLKQIVKAAAAKDPAAQADDFEISEIDYGKFAKLRSKYQAELRKINQQGGNGQGQKKGNNAKKKTSPEPELTWYQWVLGSIILLVIIGLVCGK
jgi:hypothetical protein